MLQQQLQQDQKDIYRQEQSNTIGSHSPQIVFPVNYHTKNYQSTDQDTYNLNTIPSTTHTASVFHDKVIPGKGVSNLAIDVFGEPQRAESAIISNQPRNHFVSSTESNFVTPSAYRSSATIQTAAPTTTTTSTTTTTTPASVQSANPTGKKSSIVLPDEVPDDLRAQLLSSGILDNADISVLDYDKVGDISLDQLPPEHLANFYGAGGGSQISSSNRVLNIVRPNGEQISDLSLKTDDKKYKAVPKKHNVDLKVVRFDANSRKTIADKYIEEDSTVLPSVNIRQPYNRYLPLKVNGEQFPIPDTETLRNKKISTVVVLAPVDGFSSADKVVDDDATDENDDIIEDGRYERDVVDSKEIKFFAGDSLKTLLRKPTKENFKNWLQKEAKTNADTQSVVLLVVK